MSEGALRQLFASFVFSFDQTTLQKANAAVDSTKAKVGGLSNAFGNAATVAKGRLGASIGNITGWTSAITKARKQADESGTASMRMFEGLRSAALKYVGAFAAVKLAEFANQQVEEGEKVFRISKRVGTSFEELQAISKFVAPAGVGIQQLQRPLLILNKSITAAAKGAKGPAVDAFKDLGIGIAKGSNPKTLDVFYQLAGALGEMTDDAKRSTLAMRLMGPAGAALLPAFEVDRAAVERLRQEIEDAGPAMSEDFGKNAEKLGRANRGAASAFKALRIAAVGVFLPIWARVAGGFAKGTKEVVKFIKSTQVLQTLIAVLATRYLNSLLMSTLAKVIVKFGSLTNAARAFNNAGAMTLIKWAGLILIGLLLEDLVTTLQGGDSAIKRLLESMIGTEGAKAAIEDLRNFWHEFGDDIKGVGKSIGSWYSGVFLSMLAGAGIFFAKSGEDRDRWVAAFMRSSAQIGKFFDDMFGAIGGKFKEQWQGMIDWFAKVVQWFGKLGLGGSGTMGGVPAFAPPSGSKTVTINDNRSVNATVPGGDTQATRKVVGDISSALDAQAEDVAAAFRGVP